MIIYNLARPTSLDDSEITLTEVMDGVRVQRSDLDFTFKFEIPNRPDIALVFSKLPGKGVGIVWCSELCHTRDGMSSIKTRKLISDELLLAVALVEGVTVVYSPKAAFINSPFTKVPKDVQTLDILAAAHPLVADLVASYFHKQRLVSKINPLDSLASLEKQVDLLTKLVISLARKQPITEQPEWLNELETVFMDTSSVKETDLEKSIVSIRKHKSHIRALQDVYFKAKNG